MNSTLSVPCSSAPADVRLSVSSPEASHVQWHEDHEDTAATAAAPIASPDDATRVGLMTASSVDSADADDMIVCRVKKYEWSPPPGEEHHVYRPHQGEGSQYLRDVVLGVNDGCLSTFLVIVGLVAGGASVTTCLLSAISTAVAGAISMGLGEYVATKSQANVNKGEEQLEKEHFRYHRDVELEQLRGFLSGVGLTGNLLNAVVSEVGRSDESMLKMMLAFEFGASGETSTRSPVYAMWTSGRLFLMGALPTVLPFFGVHDAFTGLWIAALLVAATLFVVGVYKSRTTAGNPWYEGSENLLLGAVGAAISYAVGVAFQAANGGGTITA